MFGKHWLVKLLNTHTPILQLGKSAFTVHGIQIESDENSCYVYLKAQIRETATVCGFAMLQSGPTLHWLYAGMDESQLRLALNQIESLWIRFRQRSLHLPPEFSQLKINLHSQTKAILDQGQRLRHELGDLIWSKDHSVKVSDAYTEEIVVIQKNPLPTGIKPPGQIGLRLDSIDGHLVLEPLLYGQKGQNPIKMSEFSEFDFSHLNQNVLEACHMFGSLYKTERSSLLSVTSYLLAPLLLVEGTILRSRLGPQRDGAVTVSSCDERILLRFYRNGVSDVETVLSCESGAWYLCRPACLQTPDGTWLFGLHQNQPLLIYSRDSLIPGLSRYLNQSQWPVEFPPPTPSLVVDRSLFSRGLVSYRPRPILSISYDLNPLSLVEIGLRFQTPELELPPGEPVTVACEPGYTDLVLEYLMSGPLGQYRAAHESLPVFVLTSVAFLQWLAEDADSLLAKGFDLYLRKQKVSLTSSIPARLSLNSLSARGWLELHLSLTGPQGQKLQLEFQNLSDAGFLSHTGQFVRLIPSDVEKLRELILLGLNDDRLLVPCGYQNLLADSKEEAVKPKLPSGLKEQWQTPIETNLENFPLRLRPYQITGVDTLMRWYEKGLSGCLADEMGLGKTIQVLAFLSCMKQQNRLGKTLILCPLSALNNWEKEIIRLTSLSFAVMDKDLDSLSSHPDVILTTYGKLRSRISQLSKIDWDFVISDETQMAKNPDSLTARSLKRLRGRMRIAMTGTPLENNLVDLYSLIDFLHPGYLGNLTWFLRHFAEPIEKQDHRRRSRLLSQMLAPLILRRTKAEVLPELPEKLTSEVFLELTDTQKRLYSDIALQTHKKLEEYKREFRYTAPPQSLILSALTRLRQVCSAPWLVDESLYEQPGAKLEFLLSEIPALLERDQGILVFSQFPRVLEWLYNHGDFACPTFKLYGSHSKLERKKAVDGFQSTRGARIFLISLKAGGTALNLGTADQVFLIDPWWNPFVEQQAVDRAHRLGNTQTVYSTHLVAKNTVEDRIRKLKMEKLSRLEAFAEDLGPMIMSLDLDTLTYILGRETEEF